MRAMRLTKLWAILLALVPTLWIGAALAQQSPAQNSAVDSAANAGPAAALTSYLQIEAQPTLAGAQDRARAYAAAFPDVQGFRLTSGWYAILLGPMSTPEAANRLATLKQEGLIPPDSYLNTADRFGPRFWPIGDSSPAGGAGTAGVGGTTTGTTTGTAGATAGATSVSAAGSAANSAGGATPGGTVLAGQPATSAPAVVPPPEETRAEAMAAERAMSVDQRKELQQALQWYGFYKGGIDAAFGPGTRRSMTDYQNSKGYAPTGVLTTVERAELVGAYRADLAQLDFQNVNDADSGIEVTLPMGLVRFDSYAPPFVQYLEKGNSGLTIRLISEPGDATTLSALFQVLQTLDVMPRGGAAPDARQQFQPFGAERHDRELCQCQRRARRDQGLPGHLDPGDERQDRPDPVGDRQQFPLERGQGA